MQIVVKLKDRRENLGRTSDEACKLSMSSCENCTGVSEAKTCWAELGGLMEDEFAPMAPGRRKVALA